MLSKEEERYKPGNPCALCNLCVAGDARELDLTSRQSRKGWIGRDVDWAARVEAWVTQGQDDVAWRCRG
eukprot:228497-Rhodomonas_salina.1